MRNLFVATFFVAFFVNVLNLFDSIFFHPDRLGVFISSIGLIAGVWVLMWSNDNKSES